LVLVASIAVPRLVEARRATYEEVTIVHLNALHSAQTGYFVRNGRYAPTLSELGTISGEQGVAELPEELLSGEAAGYRYAIQPMPAGYIIRADPQSTHTGSRHFYTDESTVIRERWDGPASAADPQIP